jgi:hypothetical protein
MGSMELRVTAQENTGKVLKSFAVGLQFAFLTLTTNTFLKIPIN